jgi:glycine cleavage system H protein
MQKSETGESEEMTTLRYTTDHEWIRRDGDCGTIGISDYAQNQLGDVVFVELPDVGKPLAQGAQAAVVESVKAASEIYAPVAGKVTAVNGALNDDPSVVNREPLGAGWFFALQIANPADLEKLMDEAAYQKFVEGLK